MPRTALLSAYDKTGLVDFAKLLLGLDFTLLASGGTAKLLAKSGLPVTDIGTLVGDPILGHRVVTLSREIHAGLLSRDTEEDWIELERFKIPRIDLLYVNFYPMHEAIAKHDATLESVLEMTDIGGPTLIKSAVKGRRIVLCDARDIRDVPADLNFEFWTSTTIHNRLAAKAIRRVIDYYAQLADFMDDRAKNHAPFV